VVAHATSPRCDRVAGSGTRDHPVELLAVGEPAEADHHASPPFDTPSIRVGVEHAREESTHHKLATYSVDVLSGGFCSCAEPVGQASLHRSRGACRGGHRDDSFPCAAQAHINLRTSEFEWIAEAAFIISWKDSGGGS